MSKEEFLKDLEKRLEMYDFKQVKDLLSYYNELIDDRIESGESIEDIISKYDIDTIVKEFRIDSSLSIAKKNPTISNSTKALIAVLSVFSFPILAPILISLIILIFAIVFSLVLVVSMSIFAFIMLVIGSITLFIIGKISIAPTLFIIGVSLMLSGIFIYIWRFIWYLIRQINTFIINNLQKIFKKRGVNNEKNS